MLHTIIHNLFGFSTAIEMQGYPYTKHFRNNEKLMMWPEGIKKAKLLTRMGEKYHEINNGSKLIKGWCYA